MQLRKTIVATFYSKSVQLNLSDGRRLNLPQIMSGFRRGIRNKDEIFVFWNKGDTAFVAEGSDGNGDLL